MESKVFVKSTNKYVASKFFCTYFFDDLMNMRSYGSISTKSVLNFPKIFFDFW